VVAQEILEEELVELPNVWDFDLQALSSHQNVPTKRQIPPAN
jgi:hypothetical protein